MSEARLFFIEVENPEAIHKTILETSKVTLQCLQRNIKNAELRKEIVHNLQKLRGIIAELEELDAQLEKFLPNMKTDTFKDKKAQAKGTPATKSPMPELETTAEDGDLSDIAKAISEIESRINSLG